MAAPSKQELQNVASFLETKSAKHHKTLCKQPGDTPINHVSMQRVDDLRQAASVIRREIALIDEGEGVN